MTEGSLRVAEEEKNSIMQCLPAIAEIKDNDLRELVVEVWARIWRESPYRDDNLADIPSSIDDSGTVETLVDHTNAVTKVVLAMAVGFQEAFQKSINRDHLIASAILHDVDKMVVFERRGSKIELSELGEKIPHGFYGGHVALQLGIPSNIVHVLVSHSPIYSRIDPKNVEAILLRHGDLAATQGHRVLCGMAVIPGL